MIEIRVTNQQGATWNFPVKLRVKDPKPDDIIKLPGCEIGDTSKVTFDLYSSEEKPIPFTAGLVAASSVEFKIEPKEGQLETVENGGTQFTVSYSPTIYGKKCRGRLMINTPAQTVS